MILRVNAILRLTLAFHRHCFTGTVSISLIRTFTHCRRADSLCPMVSGDCFDNTQHSASVAACGPGPKSTRLKQ